MMFMIMNYNKWFYNQHKYLKNSRNGIEGFNDTKWVNFNKRYNLLNQLVAEMEPEDINQHKGLLVHGNNTGFDKLIDLMGRSNYTFEDINESLIETYKMSLQNAMGNNMVNTHAVMFHCNNMDKKNVVSESFTHYRIIDAPFNQLHFGHRDEFIRQKLQEMHTVSSGHYVSIDKFNSAQFTEILEFSIICTVNGYFCNDCMVAIDDKGFKFKVGWPYASDVDFIVYKLDHAMMFSNKTTATNIRSHVIPYDSLQGVNKDTVIGMKCLINVFDDHYTKTTASVPNFGVFEESGLVIRNLQQATLDMMSRLKSNEISVDIYVLKYFHEIPGLYPAVNYYDFMDTRNVYDERYEYIKTTEGHKIVSSTMGNVNNLEICTPPICIDRDMSYSFDIITRCLSMYDDMLSYESDMQFIGKSLSENADYFIKECKPRLEKIYSKLLIMFNIYQQGAIMTSLVSPELVETFAKLVAGIKKLANVTDFNEIQKYVIDELYASNYRVTVKKITEPFRIEALKPFADMRNINNNFFVDHNSTRFNRPISEQCFIALRYHQNDGCWLFDYPTIKHFNGIGNSFYVDSDLDGNEIFKFFVLYTDTIDPVETEIEKLDMKTVYDFDLFSNELEKHIGMIRYWDSECRLMKISKILYNKYDDETCVHVLSKMLKRKLNGDHFIKLYPSDINYEESNALSDQWDSYDENTERGPFSINFLFYTLSLLNNNEDKLQSYFYRYLTHAKFDNRYSDIDISSVLDSKRYPVNLSQFTISPSRIPDNINKPSLKVYAYYGLPLILNESGNNKYEPYRYVLNTYKPDIKYPLIGENDVDDSYYVQYDNIESCAGKVVSYHNIINMGRLMTLYLTDVYNYISELQTNYTKTFNSSTIIESAIKTINQHISKINTENIINPVEKITDGDTFNEVINSIINDNLFINRLNEMKSTIDKISMIRHNSINMPISVFVNTHILGNLKRIFINFGFENHMSKRVRMLYIHLKKINTPMNPYVFKKWLTDIDIHTLIILDDVISNNENHIPMDRLFLTMGNSLKTYIETAIDDLDTLQEYIKSLSDDIKNDHTLPIAQTCDYIIQHIIFDIYTLDQISYNDSIVYNTKPKFVVITIPDSSHTRPLIGTSISGTHNLIFQPIIDKTDGGYVIKSISNICEYAFFNGESLAGLSMTVINASGESIGTQQVIISFTRTCSTADRVNEFSLIQNSNTTPIDFENGHESFDVVNGLIVNEKHADMNYEMLIGNHFTQLNHEIEYVLEPETWLQGSIDRLYIDNQMINRMVIADYGHNECSNVFFKPVQVIHIPLNENGSIDSINGKYFEGERIYLKTTDELTMFPVVITKVDHSINKGFIEAHVDDWNANWIEIKDKEIITKYLTEDIECEVIDDNMRNFLDEFSDGSLTTYHNSGKPYNVYDIIELPGDPMFVTSNPELMFRRLSWMFNESVPNRFIDDEHKKYHFNYIANGFILNENDEIKINMINHDFNDMTLPEKYPVLRDEPNDHYVWDREITKFKNESYNAYMNEQRYHIERSRAEKVLAQATTYHGKEVALLEIDKWNRKIQRLSDYRKRLEMYTRQLESPTTWFNVRSYEATLVYISNGRADKFSPGFVSNIRDVVYSDKIEVLLYDWEHKQWLDPASYETETEMVDNVRIDECDEYNTNRVLHTLTIKPKPGFPYSKKILIYFAYNKSDVYDDIEMNKPTCFVKFKPVLSLCNKIDDYDLYSDIRIRKHFDGYEKYKVSGGDDIHIKRVKRSGKYTLSPKFRVCDITVRDTDTTYTFDDIESFLVRSPFIDITTPRKFHTPTYTTTIHSEIDGFQEGKEIKLICISNNGKSSYDGNISSIMFVGITSYGKGNSQQINIIKSTLPNYVKGSFVCTVFQDYRYDAVGGVMTITVDSEEVSIYDEWVKVPAAYIKYREVPEEFKLVMKQPTSGDVEVILENKYIKSTDDEMHVNNNHLWNPFEYYYDNKNLVRLPISDVRLNSHDQRMVIDKSANPNVQTVKAPYIGICRFSLNKIPIDGVIDMTGYIPNALSRERYEFWVNGRCVTNPNDITILSPTIIQLHNMKSLHNFEVIELVDDVNVDNEIMKEGTFYIDLNGNSYSNYRLAMLSNSKIRNQDVMFIFNANNNHQIHEYTKNISPIANNHDIEKDILSYVSFNDEINDYEKLYNIPSINGVSLFHPKLQDLGISEIPHDKIINAFDNVWKYEEITNPLFFTTHRSNRDNEDLILYSKQLSDPNWNGLSINTTGMFVIRAIGPTEKYFSLYLSKKKDGKIDDIRNTVKIIPFVTSGIYILIDKKYQGLWLHATHGDTKPIHMTK